MYIVEYATFDDICNEREKEFNTLQRAKDFAIKVTAEGGYAYIFDIEDNEIDF